MVELPEIPDEIEQYARLHTPKGYRMWGSLGKVADVPQEIQRPLRISDLVPPDKNRYTFYYIAGVVLLFALFGCLAVPALVYMKRWVKQFEQDPRQQPRPIDISFPVKTFDSRIFNLRLEEVSTLHIEPGDMVVLLGHDLISSPVGYRFQQTPRFLYNFTRKTMHRCYPDIGDDSDKLLTVGDYRNWLSCKQPADTIIWTRNLLAIAAVLSPMGFMAWLFSSAIAAMSGDSNPNEFSELIVHLGLGLMSLAIFGPIMFVFIQQAIRLSMIHSERLKHQGSAYFHDWGKYYTVWQVAGLSDVADVVFCRQRNIGGLYKTIANAMEAWLSELNDQFL